jgi:hypothetical protein
MTWLREMESIVFYGTSDLITQVVLGNHFDYEHPINGISVIASLRLRTPNAKDEFGFAAIANTETSGVDVALIP